MRITIPAKYAIFNGNKRGIFWFFSAGLPTFTDVPRTFRQYLRSVLVPLGLADRRAFHLALKKINPDDTFIVSFPKSGNTWMRFLLAYLISGKDKISFREIDSLVPDIYTARKEADEMQSPRFLKAHDPCFDYYPKCIYIVRDYRDVFVSYFHYHKALGNFTGDMHAYENAIDSLHPFGKWETHVKKAIDFSKQHPERILILRYEDLMNDAKAALQQVISFCKINPQMEIENAIERAAFAALKDEENKSGSAFMDLGKTNFFREGKTGNWKTEMPAELAVKLTEQHRELFAKLGYT